MRTHCVLDLNCAGSERLGGCDEPIASFVAQHAARPVNILTLQELCANQYTAIRKALGAGWDGYFKDFGPMPGCHGRKHGLAIFTRGKHSAVEWRHLEPGPVKGR